MGEHIAAYRGEKVVVSLHVRHWELAFVKQTKTFYTNDKGPTVDGLSDLMHIVIQQPHTANEMSVLQLFHSFK